MDVRSARSRAVFSGSRLTVAPSSASWLPVRNFVAEWTTTSAPSSSARRKTGVETVASATTSPPWARTASQSGTVSTGFAGDSTQTTSAGGGVPVWSYSTNSMPQRPSSRSSTTCRSCALGERDLRARPRQREQHGRLGRHAGRVEQRVAALELAEPSLGRGAGRVAVARVVELARSPAGSYGQMVERSTCSIGRI